MSFQAYLDAIETKTGQTPEQLVTLLKTTGSDLKPKPPESSTVVAQTGVGPLTARLA